MASRNLVAGVDTVPGMSVLDVAEADAAIIRRGNIRRQGGGAYSTNYRVSEDSLGDSAGSTVEVHLEPLNFVGDPLDLTLNQTSEAEVSFSGTAPAVDGGHTVTVTFDGVPVEFDVSLTADEGWAELQSFGGLGIQVRGLSGSTGFGASSSTGSANGNGNGGNNGNGNGIGNGNAPWADNSIEVVVVHQDPSWDHTLLGDVSVSNDLGGGSLAYASSAVSFASSCCDSFFDIILTRSAQMDGTLLGADGAVLDYLSRKMTPGATDAGQDQGIHEVVLSAHNGNKRRANVMIAAEEFGCGRIFLRTQVFSDGGATLIDAVDTPHVASERRWRAALGGALFNMLELSVHVDGLREDGSIAFQSDLEVQASVYDPDADGVPGWTSDYQRSTVSADGHTAASITIRDGEVQLGVSYAGPEVEDVVSLAYTVEPLAGSDDTAAAEATALGSSATASLAGTSSGTTSSGTSSGTTSSGTTSSSLSEGLAQPEVEWCAYEVDGNTPATGGDSATAVLTLTAEDGSVIEELQGTAGSVPEILASFGKGTSQATSTTSARPQLL